MNVSVIQMLLAWAMLGIVALFPLSWLLQGGRAAADRPEV